MKVKREKRVGKRVERAQHVKQGRQCGKPGGMYAGGRLALENHGTHLWHDEQ